MAPPFDGLMRTPFAPSEASSSSSSQEPYAVFINHHRGDVKHGLATTIYNKLDAAGLRVFLDKYELKIGIFFPRALQEAMLSSRIHIAIFSKNYARSPWCLAELVYILQLPDINFIPIFYDVFPSDLRWAIEGKGTYADAFNNYEMKSSEEKAVMNVVNRVLKELEKNPLYVANYPVGLGEVEQDFHDSISVQSAVGPAQIVRIYGMGGLGKTTLAKHIYKQNHGCLSDVPETAKNNRLHEKQKKLLRFKEILKSRLRSFLRQLDALLPARENLGHGSLILICFSIYSKLRTDRGHDVFNAEVANGKWVWMGVFPEGSDWLLSNWLLMGIQREERCKGERGMVIDGRSGEHSGGFSSAFAKLILGANLILWIGRDSIFLFTMEFVHHSSIRFFISYIN